MVNKMMKKLYWVLISFIGLSMGFGMGKEEPKVLDACYQMQERVFQEDISGKVIRFHIRANSDSEADQSLKMDVKQRVLEGLSDQLMRCEDMESCLKTVESLLPDIQKEAEQFLRKRGCQDRVEVLLEKSYFPEKSYANLSLPAGIYQSLVINIGSALGHNWWCVLYPQLCFIEPTTGYLPEESIEYLEDNLTKEECRWILFDSKEQEKYVAKLKVIEWLEEKINKPSE